MTLIVIPHGMEIPCVLHEQAVFRPDRLTASSSIDLDDTPEVSQLVLMLLVVIIDVVIVGDGVGCSSFVMNVADYVK
jgi:hypothetical protein